MMAAAVVAATAKTTAEAMASAMANSKTSATTEVVIVAFNGVIEYVCYLRNKI